MTRDDLDVTLDQMPASAEGAGPGLITIQSGLWRAGLSALSVTCAFYVSEGEFACLIDHVGRFCDLVRLIGEERAAPLIRGVCDPISSIRN